MRKLMLVRAVCGLDGRLYTLFNVHRDVKYEIDLDGYEGHFSR